MQGVSRPLPATVEHRHRKECTRLNTRTLVRQNQHSLDTKCPVQFVTHIPFHIQPIKSLPQRKPRVWSLSWDCTPSWPPSWDGIIPQPFIIPPLHSMACLRLDCIVKGGNTVQGGYMSWCDVTDCRSWQAACSMMASAMGTLWRYGKNKQVVSRRIQVC